MEDGVFRLIREPIWFSPPEHALQTRPVEQTIFHSDRGSRYGSAAFRQALDKVACAKAYPAGPTPITMPGHRQSARSYRVKK